ncbi:PP2C family protein-serine/threonine phosphatase [Thermospira aquatica]|uniref:SpoIIE family protein phosphatase n=1 Tax=Thermospira aquatica TaxID=2828656 RepID=A0AAX3BCR3_9SPIR|nr:SpoIIE family protein phosphatase [Thermospira aquatica]URA10097.1 SpoIIE family protein phosphatase [Thermospira aquatica]
MRKAFFCFLLFASSFSFFFAEAGVFDLRDIEWTQTTVVRLSGEWLFYPMRFLDPTKTVWEEQTSLVIRVPDSWHRYQWEGHRLSPYGYGTYRATILTTNLPMLLGLRIPFITSSYEIYINGKLMASMGKVGTNRQTYIPRMLPQYITFTNTSPLEIVMHVANFYDNKGGMYNSLEMGLWDTIVAKKNINIAFDIFIIGALVIMALYHLALFTLQRKEWGLVYFSLLALMLAFRTLTNHECVFPLYIYEFSWQTQVRMDFVLVNLITIFVVAFMRTVFTNPFYRNVLSFSILFYGILTAIDLFFPEEVYFHTQMIFIFYTLPLGFFILFALIKNMFSNKDAFLLLLGFSIFFLTALNDIFYAIQKFNVFEIYLTPFGQLVFVFFQAFVLSRRFSVAYQISERLKQNLEKEVERQTIELLKEKNKLLEKNQLIEEELELARQIQLQFIPSKPPSRHFAFYFHPMIQIGGDFFDIRRIDTYKWGVFISDVSGHGVPAAFITSLIKSHLLQSSQIHDPAALFYGLNEFLFPFLAGNFVTALYIIYDEEKQTLTYANAGHLDPLLVFPSGSLVPLPFFKRGIPLGVLRNQEIQAIDKGYTNHTYHFTEGKLLLFTDGLIEAVSEKIHVPFEEILWSLPWKEISKFSAPEIVIEIIENFKQHVQLEKLSDDICLVCFEKGDDHTTLLPFVEERA